MTTRLNQLLTAEGELQSLCSSPVSASAKQLLDLVKIFQVNLALIPASLDAGHDSVDNIESLHKLKTEGVSHVDVSGRAINVICSRGIDTVVKTTQLIHSVASLHDSVTNMVMHAVQIQNQNDEIKKNIALLQGYNKQLIDAILIASHGLDIRHFENALDVTSGIVNDSIRSFWTKKFGKNVDRVDNALFIKCLLDHIKENIKSSRNNRLRSEEKINDDSNIAEIVFLRILTTFLSGNNEEQISVYDVVARLSGFDKMADRPNSVADSIIETEINLLNRLEFHPVATLKDHANVKADYEVIEKGESGLYHADKIIKTTPLQRVPIFCKVPRFNNVQYPKDGVTLLRYDDVQHVSDLAEKTSFALTEVETSRAYLSKSNNALYVDSQDFSSWNTIPNILADEYVPVSHGVELQQQFGMSTFQKKDDSLQVAGLEGIVEMVYTPLVDTPGIYSVRNFLEDQVSNDKRYLFNNSSSTVHEQFEKRDFFFQPITIKGIGIRNMYQYIELVISLLCVDMHHAIQFQDLVQYNATNRFVDNFVTKIVKSVNSYRNDAASIPDVGHLPIIKFEWFPNTKKNSNHVVKLSGTFNNWSITNRIILEKSMDSYGYVTRLFPGRYLFKFEVDGIAAVSEHYNTIDFQYGDVNYIDVTIGQTIGNLSRNSNTEPSVEVDFTWEEGGEIVELVGSFSNWIVPIRLTKSTVSGDFSVKVLLCEGHHQYRFIVDGKIRVATHQANVRDPLGNINNVIYVSKHEDENEIHCHYADNNSNKFEKQFESTFGREDLAVTGSFLDWNKSLRMKINEAGVHISKKKVSLSLGRHDYVFIVDGMWKYDPLLPFRYDDRGNIVNFLIVRHPPDRKIPTTPATKDFVTDHNLKKKILFVWGPCEANVHKRVSILVKGGNIYERLSMFYSTVDKSFNCVADLPLGQYNYQFIVDGEYRLAYDQLVHVNVEQSGQVEVVNRLTITEANEDYVELVSDTPLLPFIPGTPQSIKGVDRHSYRSPLAGSSTSTTVTPSLTHGYSPPPSLALTQRVMVEFDVTTTAAQTKEVLLIGTFSSQSGMVGAEMDRALDSDNKYHKSMSVVLGEQYVYYYAIDGVRSYSPEQVLYVDPFNKQVKNFLICGESILNGHKRKIGDSWYVAHEFSFKVMDSEESPHSVYLTGNFVDWEKEKILMARYGKVFKTTLMLRPGKYEYNFVVDHAWKVSKDDEFTVVRESSHGDNHIFHFNVLFLSDGDMLDGVTGLQALDSVTIGAIQSRAMKQFHSFMVISAHTTTTDVLTRCADAVDRLTAIARQITGDPVDRTKAQFLLDKFPASLIKKENFLALEKVLGDSTTKKVGALLTLKISRFFDLVELLDGVHRFSKSILKDCVDHLPFLSGNVSEQLDRSRKEYRILLDLFLVWGKSINNDIHKITSLPRTVLMKGDNEKLNGIAQNCLSITQDRGSNDRLLRDYYFTKMLMLELASEEAVESNSFDELRNLSQQILLLQELLLDYKEEIDEDCCTFHNWFSAMLLLKAPEVKSNRISTKDLLDVIKKEYLPMRTAHFPKDLTRIQVLEVASKLYSKLADYLRALKAPMSQRETPLVLPHALVLQNDVHLVMETVGEWISALHQGADHSKKFIDLEEICDPALLETEDFDKYVLAMIGILKSSSSADVVAFVQQVQQQVAPPCEAKGPAGCCEPEVTDEPLALSSTLQTLLATRTSLSSLLTEMDYAWSQNSLHQYRPERNVSDNIISTHWNDNRVNEICSNFSTMLDMIQKTLLVQKGDVDSFVSKFVHVPSDLLDKVRYLHVHLTSRLDHYKSLHFILNEYRSWAVVDELAAFRAHEERLFDFLDETVQFLHMFFHLIDLLQILLKLRKEVAGSFKSWRANDGVLANPAASKHLSAAENKIVQMQIIGTAFRRAVDRVTCRLGEIESDLRSLETWIWDQHDYHDLAIASMVLDHRFYDLPQEVKTLLDRTIACHLRLSFLDTLESTKCGDFVRVRSSVSRLTVTVNDMLDSLVKKNGSRSSGRRQETLLEFGSYFCDALSTSVQYLPTLGPLPLAIWGELETEMTKSQSTKAVVRDIKGATHNLMEGYHRPHAVKDLLSLRFDVESYINATLMKTSSTTESAEELSAFVLELLRRVVIDLTDLLRKVLLEAPSSVLKSLLEHQGPGCSLVPHGLLIEVEDVNSLAWGQLPVNGKNYCVVDVSSFDPVALEGNAWKPAVSMRFPFNVLKQQRVSRTIAEDKAKTTHVAVFHYLSSHESPRPNTLIIRSDGVHEEVIVEVDPSSPFTLIPVSRFYQLLLKDKEHRVRVFLGVGRHVVKDSPMLELEMVVDNDADERSIESKLI